MVSRKMNPEKKIYGTYSNRDFNKPVPEFEFPEDGMASRAAYEMIHEELKLDGWVWTFWSIGAGAAFAIGYVFYMINPLVGWRYTLAIGAIPAIITVVKNYVIFPV